MRDVLVGSIEVWRRGLVGDVVCCCLFVYGCAGLLSYRLLARSATRGEKRKGLASEASELVKRMPGNRGTS